MVQGKEYVEIGAREGDILACVAHYARKAAVVEANAEYCKGLRHLSSEVTRQGSLSTMEVICPFLFDAEHAVDADVYYTWMLPPVLWEVLGALHGAMVAGKIRSTAKLVTIGMPLSERAKWSFLKQIYIWQEVHTAQYATRSRMVDAREYGYFSFSTIMEDVPKWYDVRFALLEFDLAEKSWSNLSITKRPGPSDVYQPDRHPVPYYLRSSPLNDLGHSGHERNESKVAYGAPVR